MGIGLAGFNKQATAAIAAKVFRAVRLDYNRRTETLLLSVVKPDGAIAHHELPLSITFTSAEIAAWLCGAPLVIPQAFIEPPPGTEREPVEAVASG